MNTLGRSCTLLLLCVLAAACTTTSVAEAPASKVEAPLKRFLEFYFNDYRRGLPEESQLPRLASFVTPELLDLFEAAVRGQGCYLEKINYQGPAPVQGDLFSSLFEGATSATYSQIVQEMDKATFEIEWTSDFKELSPEPSIWQDRVFVVKRSKGWLIADFAHDGTWDFMMKGNVSEILRAVSKECAD